MVSPREWGSSIEMGQQALIISIVTPLVYTALIIGYCLHPASNVTLSGSVGSVFGLYSVMAFGTIGIPLLVRVRYGLRGPVVLMAFILLFWHVLVEFPPIGSGQGDSPGFLFVFAFAPMYVVAYGVLAGGEYWVRRRNRRASFASE